MKHPKLLSNHLVIQRFSWVLFTVTVFITSQIMSQTANNQYRTINSKTAPPETFKFISPKTCLVEVPGATWIQIIFGRYNLNKSGTVTIYNEDNGESQTFNQNQLDSWNGMSALFNSSRLRISASKDVIFYELYQILVGERGVSDLAICGEDDRIASNDVRIGRIIMLPDALCTAWIIGDNTFLTAGHCFEPNNMDKVKNLEFNVPPESNTDGTPILSAVRDQYPILKNTIVFSNDVNGNDWAVFRVGRNTETGLLPLQAQDAQFFLSNSLDPDNLTITGYGKDDENTKNHTQQTNTGPSSGHTGTSIEYIVDTEWGNSGSPVISANGNQQAIGIHNGPAGIECDDDNEGTNFLNEELWKTINEFLQVQVHYWPIQNGIRQGGINIHSAVNSTYWIFKGAGDVDNNGTDDIIWQHKDGQVHYWAMSNGTRQGGYDIGDPVSIAWDLKGSGDVNGDGTDDIIWQHKNGQVHYWAMSLGEREGGLDISTPVSDEWNLKGIGDVDNNGTDDIIWQHKNGQVHYWAMSNGVRQSGHNIHTPVGNEWNLIGSGDVDGNRTDDIIWQYKNGQVHFWSMSLGEREGGQNISTPVGQDWSLKTSGDVNGDGTDDILWLNISVMH